MRTLIYNISNLVTLAPLANEMRFNRIKEKDLGVVKDAWILIESGKIQEVGSGALPQTGNLHLVDARNGTVMPGLIDSHTHPIFAGSRSHEFALRLRGKTYQEIANLGGGINYTVAQTRQASFEHLAQDCKKNLLSMLSFGTTTVEAKSGYGLSTESELKILRVLQSLKREIPLRIYSTCLSLHALPPDQASVELFVKDMTENLLPAIVDEKLADAVDAFIETGYFTAEEAAPWLRKAQEMGLHIRLHADEFTDSHGAKLAAQFHATSADHLQFAHEEGIIAMAKQGVIATLLPGTSLYTGINFTDGRKLADNDCAIAIATDFNPGSCQFYNLPFIASMAGIHCKLRPEEVIAGVTFVAARSLRMETFIGALVPGYQADLIIHPSPSIDHWLADMGRTAPSEIMIQGKFI